MSSNRYFSENIKKNSDGKKVYRTVLYPEIKLSDFDEYIFAVQGDRLDLLAYKYYGDSTKWWIIAHANKIKGTLYLPKDAQLVIPMKIDKILQDYQELNS